MTSKKLLILERSGYDLSSTKSNDGSVVLEGVFTEIGVKNKNNRIYEESEVLPHIKELQEKVKTSKLLGELDHPKDFDISLANVSHVIEDLHYDQAKKQVLGRIRLLNTTKGKEAQALISDGIPLHISSRAAGNVDENGRVKIKKFFTYDLVADPGFANAELSRVNESFGFEADDNLFIYEIQEKKENKKENNKPMEENKNFVLAEDFNKYTEYLQNELKSLKEAAVSSDKELLEKLIKYTETIGEKVNQIADYTEYLSENLDASISHNDHIVEGVNQIKKYTGYLAEELDNNIRYTEHVAEKADQGIQYTQHVAEKADQGIRYIEHVAEKADAGIRYANYLGEKSEQIANYTEYLAEKGNQTIEYTNYLKEGIENGISYAEHIAESVNEGLVLSKAKVAENLNKNVTVQNERVDSVTEKVNALLEQAKANKIVPKGDHHFMNFLTESKKSEFASLNESAQALLVANMNKGLVMSSIQAENIWESTFKPQRTTLDFIQDMPEKFTEKWNNLTEARRNQILAESKFHPLNTQYQINNFWQTRDLRSTQVSLETLTENKTAAEISDTEKTPMVNEAFAADLISRVKNNLGRN
jgi:methyl-accepting chemotaxis protein